jgi:hypothetical protein
MTNTEKAAYVRGLAEGLQLEPDKKETKVIQALIDLVEDMTVSLQELQEAYNELADQVDEIDEDLAAVEEDLYDEDSCDGDCEDCDGDCFDDECYYEVTCPSCHETICLNEQMLEDGELDCPNCGEKLEFDLEDVADDSEE